MGSKFFRFVILPIGIMVLVIGAYFVIDRYMQQSTVNNIEFIKQHISSRGQLIDIRDEICVESAKDIKLFVTKKKVKISFGLIDLEWKTKDFLKPDNLELLKGIGLEIRYDDKKKKTIIEYRGEEVERWVS